MDKRAEIQKYIKKVRAKFCLTQAEFSLLIGIKKSTYANYEAGLTTMPAHILLKIQELEKRRQKK